MKPFVEMESDFRKAILAYCRIAISTFGPLDFFNSGIRD